MEGMSIEKYPEPKCEMALRQPTVTERLTARKRALEAQLADVNAALDALNANPGVAAIFDQVSRVVR